MKRKPRMYESSSKKSNLTVQLRYSGMIDLTILASPAKTFDHHRSFVLSIIVK